MDQFKIGDKIEHRLMPGFTMTVEGAEPCEADANRPGPHLMYQVTDPEGNTRLAVRNGRAAARREPGVVLMLDESRWWLLMPPCPRCDRSHVLTDCARRLPFEVSTDDRT